MATKQAGRRAVVLAWPLALAPMPSLAAAPPTALAVFDFELEDASATGSAPGEPIGPTEQLGHVTNEVRRLIADSGRYRVVDTASADAAAARSHTLRDCDGCDAAIARDLGAEQSLVGVVRRISRTEYTVRFRVRDARTGAVVADADSGLRMGADYSWSRGAARLIQTGLLDAQGR